MFLLQEAARHATLPNLPPLYMRLAGLSWFAVPKDEAKQAMKKRPFNELSRDEQRASLVRRFKKHRRDAEELLTAREVFNDELRRRGETPLKPFPEQVRIIAWCDQNLKALQLGEAPTAGIELPDEID